MMINGTTLGDGAMTAGRSVARRMLAPPFCRPEVLKLTTTAPKKRQNSQQDNICETDKTKEETQGIQCH